MLRIAKVVLFKHGVGYFEREGTVHGDETLEFHFKASEMNDVLKSLTVLDMAGGHVASISYESTLPTEKRLEDIAFRLPDGGSLSGLLEQLKGARVEVSVGSQSVVGVVAGLETEWRRVDRETLSEKRLVLLCEGSSVQAFALQELKQVKLLDESVQRDLQHLLDVLIGSKKKDVKRLTVFSRGQGERAISASYVVETPVWKTSYRLILGGEKPLLQGWALVDNTQDEDWGDVQLTLVAGLPVSFVHDLYSPRYQRRPTVAVADQEAYAPPVVEEGFAAAEEADVMTMVRSAPPPPAAMPKPKAPPSRAAMALQSAPVRAKTSQVGDLFEYRIERPVSVKRGESALVPILASAFEGKRVALYNRDTREENPMSALLLRNTTGLTLEGGPATVLENDSYLGEAMLELLRPGDERIVPFSVELGCSVLIDHKSSLGAVHRTRIASGMLHFHKYREARTIYHLHNKTEQPLDLFLDHRFHRGYELVNTLTPVATTENYLRFRMEVPVGREQVFTVIERGDDHEMIGLANLSREQVGVWLQSQTLGAAAHAALADVLGLNDVLRELNGVISQHEQELKRIGESQERVRKNLSALGDSKDERSLRERYVADLGAEEDALRDLMRVIQQSQRERERLRVDLAKKVRDLSFDSAG
ncbi:MAG: hypothetical protein R3B13_09330 [Polyangiaceae bacterium]